MNGRRGSILVVDDSAVVRQVLKALLERGGRYQVLLAGDPYEAVAVLGRQVPDVILLDVDMPRMDGLTFLKKLMRQHPLPVILCTDHPERGLAGLEYGARAVLAKPDWRDAGTLSDWGDRLHEALVEALDSPEGRGTGVTAPSSRHDAGAILPRQPYGPVTPADPLIVLGASTGGVPAIAQLLAGLPAASPGIVVVEHMPAGFTQTFARRLDRDEAIPLRVVEAGPDEPVVSGTAIVVPGGRHGLIRRAGRGYRVELMDGPPVNRHRPSVDVLFRSAAQAAGPRAAGVLLTGMLDDGARGLLELREDGALTIAQDEATCVVFGMPREAIRLGAARLVLPLDQIASALRDWAARTR
jgi:two-component system chemotaxis response regulator CheB